MYYFYMIQSVNKPTEIYTGSTNDLKGRILQHNQGKVSSTKRYIPWRLVYYEAYLSEKDARIREQKFKRHGKSNIELKKRLKYSLGNYKNKKKGEGFTIIELLIAIFILSIGISAILTMFPLGIQIVRSSKMAAVAVYLGEAEIEEIISTSYEGISIGTFNEPSLPSPFTAYGRETEVTCFDPNNVGISPDCPNDTGMKKIKVTVFWNSPLKITDENIELTTLISRK